MSLHDALLAQIRWGDPRTRAGTIRGLGAPLEATRRDRTLVAGLLGFAGGMAAVGVAGTVRAAISTMRESSVRGGDLGTSVAQLIAIPVFFLGVAAVVIFVTRRRMRDFVAVFEHGIAVDSNGRLRLVGWHEVAHLHEEIADLVSGMTRRAHDTYRIQLRDGSVYSWNWEFERHREVGLCCRAVMNRHVSMQGAR